MDEVTISIYRYDELKKYEDAFKAGKHIVIWESYGSSPRCMDLVMGNMLIVSDNELLKEFNSREKNYKSDIAELSDTIDKYEKTGKYKSTALPAKRSFFKRLFS